LTAAIPTFQTTSEIIGGLLGAYTMNGDGSLLERAAELGKMILDSFFEDLPMPVVKINVSGRVSRSARLPLVTIGGLSLDLCYLGDLLGDPKFRQMTTKLGEYIRSAYFSNPDMFAEEIELQLDFRQPHHIYSLGYQAGPVYEYMIKDSIYTANRDKRASFIATQIAQVRPFGSSIRFVEHSKKLFRPFRQKASNR
jgi:hypothetical protein